VERDTRRTWMEKKIKNQGSFFLHICMITEGVWTQVAQVNKFGEPDFHFASSWT
jgi:hypothetical protein